MQTDLLQAVLKVSELVLRSHFGDAKNVRMDLVDDANNRIFFAFRLRGEHYVGSLSPVLLQIILNVIVGKSDRFLPECSNRREEYDQKQVSPPHADWCTVSGTGQSHKKARNGGYRTGRVRSSWVKNLGRLRRGRGLGRRLRLGSRRLLTGLQRLRI